MATHDEMARSFGAAAGEYEQGRPEYPADAVRWLLEHVPQGARVADVGAGTGKLTRVVEGLLAHAGGEVIAVEPDSQMLDALRGLAPGVETLVGTAEHINMPDESLDAVVLGQAWHWVEPVAGSAEVARVLKPGGTLGLIWNIRDESVPWVARLTQVMKGSAAEQLLSGDGPRVEAPFGELERRSWEWKRPMTRAALTSMVLSRSYIITASPDDRARIEREIGALFDEIGAVGEASVDLPYLTHAFRTRRP
ncbi:MAG: SAM-dependent methyltransferase [Microbacterium sp.]|nr:MAG: SAM-dependent methyltransferase [Microbacterium sp.]